VVGRTDGTKDRRTDKEQNLLAGLLVAAFSLDLIFDPEDVGDMFLRNVS
jgi:hypothetical protein